MKLSASLSRVILAASPILLFGSGALPGQVLINEIMYHPPPAIPESPAKEWIELYNGGTNTVDLTGWRLTKGVNYSFSGIVLPAGGYLVVAANPAVFATNYPAVTNVVGGWTGKLRNNGDTIELDDALGRVVNKVAYANEGDWAARRVGDPYPGQTNWWSGWQWATAADGAGRTIELVNSAVPNSSGQNWAPSLADGGTPGQPNSVATNHIAPMILDARHLPAMPKPTNNVAVTARILQETGSVATVTLFYRLDGAGSFSSTPMLDDSAHGDGAAGDGVFGAVLPAQPDKTIVEFYIRAQDPAGRARTWPGPTDDLGTQAANALYQVDANSYTGSQQVYRLIIKASEWSTWVNLMDNIANGRFSDAQMNGSLVRADGSGADTRYCLGIRNRGAGTRAAHPHNLHITIPNDHALQGISQLDFNTRTVHSQVAGNAIFTAADLLNAYGTPVQVRVNGNNLANANPAGGADTFQFGSYYCFQPYDSDWAKVHEPQNSGGNVYKGVWYFDGVSLQRDADLAYLGTNVAAYRQAYSPTGPTSTTGPYVKANNISEDDWSDLINLTFVLSSNTPDANYLQAVSQAADIDQWLRYFAVNSLINNMETTLGTGVGDDFSAYRGVADPRFEILNHDLDTILGQGDVAADYSRSIFKACDLASVNRFLKFPDIAPRYYATLKYYADTLFTPPQIGAILDQNLGGWVPANYIQAMKDSAERRRTNVLGQIPQRLTVSSALPISNGYHYTAVPNASLSGSANAILTRSVLVNGAAAAYVPWQATWSSASVPLNPGINRVLVQALNTNGVEFARTNIDIWFDDGSVQTAGGTLAVDTVWSAAGGPYDLTSTLTVPGGVTLTIEPGTTVYLESGVNLVVANGGRLLAEGAANAPIRFTVAPGSGVSWGGVTINGTVGSPETRIAHAFFEGNSTTCIEVAGGTIYLDHTSFGTTTHQYLALDGSSFVVSRCNFPSATTQFELVHGTGGIKAGGRGIVRECYFGSPIGYNDAMDFTGGNRDLGQPIIQYYNNVFVGATDDILDLDGTDAWVEGNIFLHVHKNGAPDSSSAVSGGSNGLDTSDITMVRNLIFDCDQAATAKQGNFYTLLNNTIVHTTKAGGQDTASGVVNVQDRDPSPTTYGRGFYLEGNVIVDAEQLVRNYDPAQTTVTFSNNLLPLVWSGPGGGNSTNDPMLKYLPQVSEAQFATWEQAQVMWDWFSLRPGSPGRGTGPNGTDMGAGIPSGVSISGEPAPLTTATGAMLTPGFVRTGNGIPTAGFPNGSGYTHYKWRLDGGAWGPETPLTTPILLSGLGNGPHGIEAVGKRDSDWYQDAAELGAEAVVSSSRTWVVDTTWRGLVINELLADNQGSVPVNDTSPDMIELYNAGTAPIDLTGMSLTDATNNPARFTFPPGSSIGVGQYFVLVADTNPGTNHTGFALSKNGGGLYLYDTVAAGQALLDSVTYGLQLTDLSIGRLPAGGWGLTRPTFGAANVAVATGDGRRVRINEWLAASAANPDFIELFNTDPVPVDIGGCYLTDNPTGWPGQNRIPALSFIAAGRPVAFIADGTTGTDASHLNFKLDAQWGGIGFFAPDLSLIDQVFYGPQSPDVSMGRTPNGGDQLAFFNIPTPGAGNPGTTGSYTVSNITVHLMSYTQSWKYNQTNNLDGVNWTATNYNDAAWPAGPGLLAFENNASITPLIHTTLADPRVAPPGLRSGHAYYFRTAFNVTNDLSAFTIMATYRLDDGGVIYTNGGELQRIRMNGGTITNQSTATGFPPDPTGNSDATADETLTFPGSALPPGTNFIAMSVHQQNTNSSDIVWGLALDANRAITNFIQATLVLNEVMANNRSITNGDGTVTDWIELYNPSPLALDLFGISLNDDPAKPKPHRWNFPAGSSLGGNSYLIVRFDPGAPAATNNGPVLNTGFGLDASGDKLFVYNGVALVDAVTFGLQAQDFSIARVPGGSGGWALSLPTQGAANVAAPLGDPMVLRVNEWMADPKAGEDWFELYNPSAQPIALGGLGLTDDLTKPAQYIIPGLSFIGAGPYGAFSEFIADSAPTNGPAHTSFKLAAGGESIGIFTPDGSVKIHSVTFPAQAKGVSEGFFPDGSANIVRFPRTPTPGAANYLVFSDVLVNEALSRPASGSQQIELFNQTDQAVDLSGCWLSDDLSDLKKLRLSDPTILQPGAYVVLNEAQFNPQPGVEPSFGLDPVSGGKLHLSLADSAGNLTGYRSTARFDGADVGVAFGQYEASTGPEFVAMTAQSFGAANPYPVVGPIIINEIHYHPPDIGTNDNTIDEFIELLNITAASVALFDPVNPTNTWHLRNGVSFDFPTNVSVAPGGYVLVVGFDPVNNPTMASAFLAKYSVPANTPLFGPWNGKLDNGGETIELNKPAGLVNGLVPRVLVDRINYNDDAPWPTAADGAPAGNGVSLQRRLASAFGDDPVNWIAALPSAGAANNPAAGILPALTLQPVNQSLLPGATAMFTAAATGASPLWFQWRLNGLDLLDATNSTLSVTNVGYADSGRYSVRVSNPYGCVLSTNAVLRLQAGPTITRQPAGGITIGAPFTFSVVAQGTYPLSYQWRLYDTNLPGASAPQLVLGSPQPSQAGPYTVVVSNSYSSTTSDVATLTVVLDSDGDGMPDWWELANGTNPYVNDANEDPDHDGMTNLQEYYAGTSPTNAASALRLTAQLGGSPNLRLSFQAVSNHSYGLERKVSLSAGWVNFTNLPAAPTNRSIEIADPMSGSTQRFYRVRTPAF